MGIAAGFLLVGVALVAIIGLSGGLAKAASNAQGAVNATAAGAVDAAAAAGHYFKGWTIGRTDQGVDMNAPAPGAPLPAIGDSTVVGIIPNWYQGQPYVWLKADNGPLAGRYYYYAEQITNLPQVGQHIPNGGTVATYAGSGTGVEAGLATANGATLARSTSGYTEGQATPAGLLFRKLLGLG